MGLLNIEYIAGLFDADGCISMYNAGRKDKRINRSIYIKNCSSMSMSLMRCIKATLGYGIIYEYSYGCVYSITKKRHILNFCNTVGPFMFIKKRQCELMAESCNLTFGSSRGKEYERVKAINDDILNKLKLEKNNNESIDFSRLPGMPWFAGMLDGDGHLVFSKIEKEDRNFPYYNRCVSIVIMNNEFANYLANKLGGSVRVDAYYNKDKPLISLEIKTKRHLKSFLEGVFSFMYLKREKAILLLSSLEITPKEKGKCNNYIYTPEERLFLNSVYSRFKSI